MSSLFVPVLRPRKTQRSVNFEFENKIEDNNDADPYKQAKRRRGPGSRRESKKPIHTPYSIVPSPTFSLSSAQGRNLFFITAETQSSATSHQDPRTLNPNSWPCGVLNFPRKFEMDENDNVADSMDSALCVPGSRLLQTGFTHTSCRGF